MKKSGPTFNLLYHTYGPLQAMSPEITPFTECIIQFITHLQLIAMAMYIYIYTHVYPQAPWFAVKCKCVCFFLGGGFLAGRFEGGWRANNVHPPALFLRDSGWKCYDPRVCMAAMLSPKVRLQATANQAACAYIYIYITLCLSHLNLHINPHNISHQILIIPI